MATNPFFDNFSNTLEQQLVDSLVVEAVAMHGIDVHYLPRTLVSEDKILGEDRNASFNSAYQIEMFIKTVDNFEGDGDLMSKFGFTVRDNMVLTVSNSRFKTDIGTPLNISRPREGDCIYFPLNKKIWEIRHVEHEANFYALGALYFTDIKLELFEFAGETFSTGVADIDAIADKYDYSESTVVTIEDLDMGATNNAIEVDAVQIVDFSENNIFGSDTY